MKLIKDTILVKKFQLTLFFIVIVFYGLNAQNNETNTWYFGEQAGLNFNNTESPITLGNSSMLSPAGCASISDLDGNLLFYTNSETVWNKNHQIMANGGNINGNINMAQNSIIVPIYGINNLYYLFTVNEDGFFHSKIDMSANNNLGEVSELNILLASGDAFGKVSAVHHADGKSIWVMTTTKNENNQFSSFYAYKVNVDGTIETPVISSETNYIGVPEGIVKFSPNGSKVAVSNYLPESMVNHLFIFDFDNNTGKVSNRESIFTSFGFFEVVSAYGIEFSNDSQYLYANLLVEGSFDINTGTVTQPEGFEKSSVLYQYGIAGNSIPSDNAIVLHREFNKTLSGALQIAKNGKIYRALPINNTSGVNGLGVINFPQLNGDLVSYNHQGVDLESKLSRKGLPNFIQSYFRTRILNENICQEDTSVYKVDTYAEITEAHWDFGDGNTSNEINPNHTYANAGNYTITATIRVNNREITTTKKITVYTIPNLTNNQELIQCDSDTDGISVFNLNNIKDKITNPDLNETLVFYETFEDAENNVNPISNHTNYSNKTANQEIFVRVINSNNCFTITSFRLNAIYVQVSNIPDFYECEDTDEIIGNDEGVFFLSDIKEFIRSYLGFSPTISIDFYYSLEEAQTKQNAIRRTILTTKTTTLWLRAEEGNLSCNGITSFNLIVNSTPEISLEDNYLFCPNKPLVLVAASSNDRFEWLNSENQILSTASQFSTNKEGTYSLKVYKTENGIECSNTKTFTLQPMQPPIIENTKTELDYNNNTISIEVSGNGNYEFSLNNIDFYSNSKNNYTFYSVPSGIQKIYIRDINQCLNSIETTFYLIGYPKFFTPNNDGINDYWEIKGLEKNSYKSIGIYDRYGNYLLALNEKNNLRWDGKFKNVQMPSNDYWYKIEFADGNVKMGHFTLKN